MSKFEGVADTLYIPLTARIYVSEHFPEYFRDDKAVSLKSEMPYEEIASKSSEYFQMAGACRFYNTDRMVSFMEVLKKQGVKISDFSEKELHLLTTANVNAVFQTVEHDFTRDEAMHYADTLDRFFSKGWKEFFGY